jgi:hypothetical protein
MKLTTSPSNIKEIIHSLNNGLSSLEEYEYETLSEAKEIVISNLEYIDNNSYLNIVHKSNTIII